MAESNKYGRIFLILEYLARRSSGATLSVIARDIGMPLSSCHDVLQRLETISAVTLTEDRRYRLGGRSRSLAASILESEHLIPVSRRHLDPLAHKLGFDVYLAVASFGTVTYVDRFRGSNPVNVNVPLGQPLAVHATAAGKLFASFDKRISSIVLDGTHPLRALTSNTITNRQTLQKEFDRIREQGFSISHEEAIVGVTGLAVPIYNAEQTLLAALHTSMLTAEITTEVWDRVLALMRSTTKMIGHDAT